MQALRTHGLLPVLFKHLWQANGSRSSSCNTLRYVASLPTERLQQAITPHVCSELSARGYAVVDGVFGTSITNELRNELLHLQTSRLMHLNHTHLVHKGQTQLLAKSGVMEAELTYDAEVGAAAPLFAQLDADRSLVTMLSLFLPQLRLESHAVKLQYNAGAGSCFPMHFDSDEQLDGRRVTVIFYLNKDWQPSHGGQLRLYPFPAPAVDIEPVNDRLLLFSSTRMLHRVLPSHAPRCCFTVWLSAGRPRGGAAAGPAAAAARIPPPSSGQPCDDMWRFLMQPAVRQHVCKLAYQGKRRSRVQMVFSYAGRAASLAAVVHSSTTHAKHHTSCQVVAFLYADNKSDAGTGNCCFSMSCSLDWIEIVISNWWERSAQMTFYDYDILSWCALLAGCLNCMACR
eukprot:GHRR01031061.1.p1 GENE.GHRR01031061.1~~GHRR01031061.1.p1  ORF type:complete len:400 (+),score=113.92 GHRR01031061.1:185-1384(+)